MQRVIPRGNDECTTVGLVVNATFRAEEKEGGRTTSVASPALQVIFYCPYFVEEESDFGGIAFECGFSQVGMQGFTELFFPTNESFGQAVEST